MRLSRSSDCWTTLRILKDDVLVLLATNGGAAALVTADRKAARLHA